MRCQCCGEVPAEPQSNLCAVCWQDQALALMSTSRKWGYGNKHGNHPVMQPKMVVCSSCGHKHKRSPRDKVGAA